MKKIISIILKLVVIVAVIWGIVESFKASTEFMSGWQTFLYFTVQSNIWIAIIDIIGIVFLIKGVKDRRIYQLFRLMLTVSITLTGIVFCFVLAPTIEGAFSLPNVLLHVITPIAAVVDYFLIDDSRVIKKYDYLFSLVPPIYYVIFAGICYLANVNFGYNHNYPYFFLNWGSPVGAFGFDFSNKVNPEYFMGTVYWIIVIAGFLALIAYLYYRFNKFLRNKFEK